MSNFAPILYMTGPDGNVKKDFLFGTSSYSNVNIDNNNSKIIKYISGKYTYYINSRLNLINLINGNPIIVTHRIHNIAMNDTFLYLIHGNNYKIWYIKHSEIYEIIKYYADNQSELENNYINKHFNKKKKVIHIKNKIKNLSASNKSLWVVDYSNNVYKITHEGLMDYSNDNENNKGKKNKKINIIKQNNLKLSSITANDKHVYGSGIGATNDQNMINILYKYNEDTNEWSKNNITGLSDQNSMELKNLEIGRDKLYGIEKTPNTSDHKNSYYLDGKYIVKYCNKYSGCDIDNLYCKENDMCCIKGKWEKGSCKDLSKYKNYIAYYKGIDLGTCLYKNIKKDGLDFDMVNYDENTKSCYLYNSVDMKNAELVKADNISAKNINFSSGQIMKCKLPCKGAFKRYSNTPTTNDISYGKYYGNSLKSGINYNMEPADMSYCTQLSYKADKNTILNSNKYVYGYQNNKKTYYGCKAGTVFMNSDNSSNKNIVWKKSIYSFPRYSVEYAYPKNVSSGICKVYGLRQCSSDEIKYRQQCACGWVNNYDDPVFWLNNNDDCKTLKGIKPELGLNVCKGNTKAYTYCCGGELNNEFSMCPPKFPYPISTKKKLPIIGGYFGGKNSFCYNTYTENKDWDSNSINDALYNQNAVACTKPPCTKYEDKKSIIKENFTNYNKKSNISILFLILLIICILVGIYYNRNL